MLAGVVYMGLNDRDRALSTLEHAYRVHDLELPFCRLDPRMRPLLPDPRFRDIMSKLGISVD
jgi:hypothetical protein